MDERAVFDQFHEALELEPRDGAYERFRASFITPPAAAKRRPVLRLRFSPMTLRIAAAVAVAAIAIALVAGYVATHHGSPTGSISAGPDKNVQAYQTMLGTENATVAATLHAGNCSATVHYSTCLPTLQQTIANVQKWSAELVSFHTPSQFRVVDGQMRRHLTAVIPALNAMMQSVTAGNQDLFTVSTNIALMHFGWIGTAVGAIDSSRTVTKSAYIDLIRSENQNLSSTCSTCQDVAGVISADQQIGALQAAVVANAAPNSLVTKDLNLQTDLAHADDALMTMGDDLITNNHAALNTASTDYQQNLQVVLADITAIVG